MANDNVRVTNYVDQELLNIQMDLERGAWLKARKSQQDEKAKSSVQDHTLGNFVAPYADTKVGKVLVHNIYHEAFVEDLKKRLDRIANGHPGHQSKGGRLLLDVMFTYDFEAEDMAFLFVRGMVSAMVPRDEELLSSTFAIDSTKSIIAEVRVKHFQSIETEDFNGKALFKRLQQEFDAENLPNHRRMIALKNYIEAKKLSWEIWSREEQLQVGMFLSEIAMAHGFIEFYGKEKLVKYTQGFTEFMTKTLDYTLADYLKFKPMVIQPKLWEEGAMFDGGYLTGSYGVIKKTTHEDVKHMFASNRNWKKVLDSVNVLQCTKWRVNKKVLEAMLWAYRTIPHDQIDGFAPAQEIPLPMKPHGYDDMDPDSPESKAYRGECFSVHKARYRQTSKRMAVASTIAIAEEFKEFDAFYFPHSMDNRGRVYPVPIFFQPQSAEYGKALMEFSEGKKFTSENQKDWLKIHGANTAGNDKLSLKDRVKWTNDHHDMIMSIAEDYQGNREWMSVDSPFSFLAFCFEYHGMMTDPDFETHLPIHVDGTCSGLQHYSAMLRDPVGAKAVNLSDSNERADIYQLVAERTVVLLSEMHDPEKDRFWLEYHREHKIDRKLTKRSTMTKPYAATLNSSKAYIEDAVMTKIGNDYFLQKLGIDKTILFTTKAQYMAHLAKTVERAIGDTVVKAMDAMKWLKKVGGKYSTYKNQTMGNDPIKDHLLTWVTPDGFVCRQNRENTKKKRVDYTFNGVRRQSWLRIPNGQFDGQKMGTCFAPNFIHSYDATHLRMILLAAKSEGMDSFGFIHDSFSTHATQMPRFTEIVREAFVDLYGNSKPLQSLYDGLPEEVKILEEIACVPSEGSFDISIVRNSEYAFS